MPLNLVLSIGLDSSLLETRNMVLHSAGYIVESASSVKEAVHRFLAGDFDLVILCHTISTRERDRLACLIRASGSHTPLISITVKPGQCDLFANATIENTPNKLLPGISEVLIKEAKKWTALSRGKQEVTDPSRKKSPILGGDFERQKEKFAVIISTTLAQAG
jgi:DNA-binding NtrC family response regulator